MKKVLAIVLAFAMIFSFAACSSKPADGGNEPAPAAETKMDKIKAAGKLVMGTSADYPPNEWHADIDGKDTIVGFDVAIGQYIADQLGVELEIVDMSFDGLCISLANGDFDIVIAGMSATEERKQSVDFATPHYNDNNQAPFILVENADKYNSIESLKGEKIGVQSGTIQVDLAIDITGEENVVSLKKAQDIVMEVKEGKLAAGLIDYSVAEKYCLADDSIMVQDIGIVYESNGQAIAVQKGNDEFVEYLNGIVDDIVSSGKFADWYQEYNDMANELAAM